MMTSWHRQRDHALWVDVYATIGGGTAEYNMVDVKHPYRKETAVRARSPARFRGEIRAVRYRLGTDETCTVGGLYGTVNTVIHDL